MKLGVGSATLACVAMLAAGFCARPAAAQQANASGVPKATAATAYDVRRESLLQGTVVRFVANSTTAPFGPHVVLQTPSGEIDVHLGDARMLASKNLALNPGDAVKITGETLAIGSSTQFVARVVQKGAQSVAVRSVRGFPLKPLAKPAGGAL